MSNDSDDSKKSGERRRSARSSDIARKVLEDMNAEKEKTLRKKKDEGSDNDGPEVTE